MNDKKKVTTSLEDYLEAIYFLSADGEVHMTDIALRIGVSKASVSRALGILEKRGYIQRKHYGTLSLTDEGAAHAAEVSRRHELFRFFLTDVLGVDPENAEIDACRMEHAVGEVTVNKLEEFIARYFPGSNN